MNVFLTPIRNKSPIHEQGQGRRTGHHVRYVLGFELAGIIAAFIVMGVLYGFGS